MTLNPVRIVEAALFSAGRPMLVDEISQATGLPPAEVKDALQALQAEYVGRDSALEVGKAGPKWSMQIRTEFADRARHLAAMEIPPKVLRTLALIAFHQPLKQSDLKAMVGSVVYDHVHELHERAMISTRQDGITKILTTTGRFLEYFGIDAEDTEGIRSFLAKKVGIVLKPKPETAEAAEGSGTPDASSAAPGPAAGDAPGDAEAAAAPAAVNSQSL